MVIDESKKVFEVVLINPPFPEQTYIKYNINARAPVSLLSIGSVLAEAGYNVHVIDGVADPAFRDEIEATRGRNVLLYGITCKTAQIPSALDVAKLLRTIGPEKPIVWGGIHPTLFPEQTCQSDMVDVVVVGEGEYTVLELANSYKESQSITSVDGIAYKNNGVVQKTAIRVSQPLDELPFPRYDVLDIDQYLYKNINIKEHDLVKKSMVVYAGLGCPMNCAFCINTALSKSLGREKYKAKSAERVLDEIDYLINEYGVEDIYFQDELFFANKSRLLAIVDGILKRGYKITWAANVYAEYFRDSFLSEAVFEKVARSGCHRLTMGVESGSERVLKILKKNIHLELVERSAHLSKKYGVIMGYSFMMAVPTEKRDEVEQTLKLIKKLLTINPNNYTLGPQVFRPYPGSDFYDLWKAEGGKEPGTLKGWVPNVVVGSYGYMPIKLLPWIHPKDYDFFYFLSTIGTFCYMPFRQIPLKKDFIIRLGLWLAFRLRLTLNFWQYPIEVKLYQLLRSLRSK